IFVVEVAVLLRRVAVALDQVVEHLEMGVDMAVEIHRHEARELKETRIDQPAETRIGKRHGVQTMAAEPFHAAPLGELVDLGWTAPPLSAHRAVSLSWFRPA